MGRKERKFHKNSTAKGALPMLDVLPISALVASIELQIEILEKRGIKIVDYENNERVLKQIRMIGGKWCYLSERNEHEGREEE